MLGGNRQCDWTKERNAENERRKQASHSEPPVRKGTVSDYQGSGDCQR
jgi:hypothetical protein